MWRGRRSGSQRRPAGRRGQPHGGAGVGAGVADAGAETGRQGGRPGGVGKRGTEHHRGVGEQACEGGGVEPAGGVEDAERGEEVRRARLPPGRRRRPRRGRRRSRRGGRATSGSSGAPAVRSTTRRGERRPNATESWSTSRPPAVTAPPGAGPGADPSTPHPGRATVRSRVAARTASGRGPGARATSGPPRSQRPSPAIRSRIRSAGPAMPASVRRRTSTSSPRAARTPPAAVPSPAGTCSPSRVRAAAVPGVPPAGPSSDAAPRPGREAAGDRRGDRPADRLGGAGADDGVDRHARRHRQLGGRQLDQRVAAAVAGQQGGDQPAGEGAVLVVDRQRGALGLRDRRELGRQVGVGGLEQGLEHPQGTGGGVEVDVVEAQRRPGGGHGDDGGDPSQPAGGLDRRSPRGAGRHHDDRGPAAGEALEGAVQPGDLAGEPVAGARGGRRRLAGQPHDDGAGGRGPGRRERLDRRVGEGQVDLERGRRPHPARAAGRARPRRPRRPAPAARGRRRAPPRPRRAPRP